MSPADPAEFHLKEWEDSQATTAAFLPLMDLLERFAGYCFQRNLTFCSRMWPVHVRHHSPNTISIRCTTHLNRRADEPGYPHLATPEKAKRA